jgi:hypothetical protein
LYYHFELEVNDAFCTFESDVCIAYNERMNISNYIINLAMCHWVVICRKSKHAMVPDNNAEINSNS